MVRNIILAAALPMILGGVLSSAYVYVRTTVQSGKNPVADEFRASPELKFDTNFPSMNTDLSKIETRIPTPIVPKINVPAIRTPSFGPRIGPRRP
jgi:hypothetical protein